MNAIGKLLTVFVFLGSLVWLGFTATLFATRAEWKKSYEDAAKKLKEAEDKAKTLNDQVIEDRKVYDARLAAADQSVAAIRVQANSWEAEYKKLQDSVAKIAGQTQKLQPTLDEYQANNKNLQAQADNLTNQVNLLTGARDAAVLAQQKAENQRTDATLQLEVTKKALDDSIERTRTLLEARQGGAADADAAFRGDVLQVGDNKGKSLDIITFSGGANAGVKAGKRYVVTRSVAPFYIGTVTVLDAGNPQFSSGVFTPANGQKLAGDYVPKKGDTVSSN